MAIIRIKLHYGYCIKFDFFDVIDMHHTCDIAIVVNHLETKKTWCLLTHLQLQCTTDLNAFACPFVWNLVQNILGKDDDVLKVM